MGDEDRGYLRYEEKQAAENRMLLVGPYVDQLRELTPATDSAEAAEPTPATDSAEPAASVRPEEPEDGTS